MPGCEIPAAQPALLPNANATAKCINEVAQKEKKWPPFDLLRSCRSIAAKKNLYYSKQILYTKFVCIIHYCRSVYSTYIIIWSCGDFFLYFLFFYLPIYRTKIEKQDESSVRLGRGNNRWWRQCHFVNNNNFPFL